MLKPIAQLAVLIVLRILLVFLVEHKVNAIVHYWLTMIQLSHWLTVV
jgi:hypothetical protein